MSFINPYLVSGQLPLKESPHAPPPPPPRLGLGFGLGLVFRLAGQFSSGTIVLEPIYFHVITITM